MMLTSKVDQDKYNKPHQIKLILEESFKSPKNYHPSEEQSTILI